MGDNIEKKTDNIEKKTDNIEKKTDNIEKKTDNIEKKTDNSKIDNENDTPTIEELKILPKKIIESKGLLSHHIDDYNNLMNSLNTIVTHYFSVSIPPTKNTRSSTDEDKLVAKWSVTVNFSDMIISLPTTSDIKTKNPVPLFPSSCRADRLGNYTTSIKLSFTMTKIAYDSNGKIIKELKDEVKNYDITTLPNMVRSKYCNTYPMRDSPEALQAIKEDPRDKGGYFIMSGNEYYVMNSENIKFNIPYIYKSTNVVSKEKTWLELISKPGDSFENSHQLYIRLGKDNSITIEIKALVDSLYIPFYMVFRMLGICIDKDIVDHILLSSDNDQTTLQIKSILDAAFVVQPDKRIESLQWNYDPDSIRLKIGELVRTESKRYKKDEILVMDEELQHRLIADVLFKIDHLFLPHIGDNISSRITKCRYLGYLIKNLLLVNIGVLEQTNRDAYTNKRIHAAGITLAKAFKNQFNLGIVQKLKYELYKLFESTSFSNVKLINALQQVNKKALEKGLAKLITSSEETITMSRGITVQNRVSSQEVHRKNEINPIISARNIETPSITAKQTERAENMRHVQETHVGYVCPTASKDTGEKVGQTKEMSITCLITPSHNGITLATKTMIEEDKELFIRLDNVTPNDIYKRGLTKVFINGNWIGMTDKPFLFVQKYREARRTGELDKYASICFDEQLDEIHVWLDHGRLIRPLIIMDNNFYEIIDAEFQNKPVPKFIQTPRITKKHINDIKTGKIDFNYLIENGIMEYIAPEEQLNCYLAKNIDEAIAEKNNILNLFTHCEMPETIYGLSSLVGPFLNHNAPTRATYETNQIKQTCGWYSMGWPWRLDKIASYQVHCEHPLVRTLVNDITNPMGCNSIFAYLCWDGNGQEDSIIMNKSSIDMGMFYVTFMDYNISTIELDEKIRIPSNDDTLDIKSRASYAKLNEDGFIEPGTHIISGDVIIPKLSAIQATTKAGTSSQYKYVDRSVIYKNDEPAIVDAFTKTHLSTTADGKKFTYVKMLSELPVMVGDKFSTRSGNKAINAGCLPAINMPITASGTPITVVANPQTITSRMVVSQLIEGIVSKRCEQKGVFVDATAFTPQAQHNIRKDLEKFGIHNISFEQVYCGRTGMAIDSLIVVAPTFFQRLQKFVIKEGYSVQSGPVDALTGQPVSGGRRTGGGARFGEMEVAVINGHGSMGILNDIMFTNSDGTIIYMCRKCGNRADVNIEKQIFKCKICGPNCDIVSVDSSIASNLFQTEVEMLNIDMKMNFT
jgi:DNA-directed RNA polymerase beta subunit